MGPQAMAFRLTFDPSSWHLPSCLQHAAGGAARCNALESRPGQNRLLNSGEADLLQLLGDVVLEQGNRSFCLKQSAEQLLGELQEWTSGVEINNHQPAAWFE